MKDPKMWGVAAPLWLRLVRGLLYGSLILLAVGAAGAAVFVALHSAPTGPTFGWPFRLAGRTNVLIMGLDRTRSDQNPKVIYPISRTDTLIAVTFDPGSRHVHLMSIPRDTRAPIPGHGTDKINAAHAYGGGALSLRTVQNFLGVSFPYYIEINERGLVHLIDAVGGITVRIDKDLDYDDNWDGLHIHLKKGTRRLGGKSAMEFVRFRHDALGDIGRIQRQQHMMNALLDELRQPRVIFRAGRVLKVFQEDITTNLTPDQLITLGWFGARLPQGGLVRETLPGTFGQTAAGHWLPDPVKGRALVARLFYGVDPQVLTGTTVEVLNATPLRDVVTDPVARIQALGLRVLRVSTVPDAAETTVTVHHGDPLVGQIVAAALGLQRAIAGEDRPGPDVTVVVAKDYTPVLASPPAQSGASQAPTP